MKARDMRDLVWFDDETARTEVLFESDRIWSQLVCLQGAQGIGPVADAGSDAIVSVLAGEVAVQLGKSRTRMGQWHAVLVQKQRFLAAAIGAPSCRSRRHRRPRLGSDDPVAVA